MDEVDERFRRERHMGAAVSWRGPLPGDAGDEAADAGGLEGSGGAAPRPVVRTGGPVGSVRYSAAVARRLCERVESGESLRAICADPDMPHRGTVRAWRERLPAFARALARARAAAGWHFMGGQKPRWNEAEAREVCARVAAGEPLSRVCDGPEMPSLAVVYRWRTERPEFAAALRLAREVQAERLCDEGWEIACAVTPETAFATRVKLAHLRWMTSYMAPRRFGRFKAVEAEVALDAAAEAAVSERITAWLVKHFKVEEREDGAQRVVTFVADPRTNQMVRLTPQDAPWGRRRRAGSGRGVERGVSWGWAPPFSTPNRGDIAPPASPMTGSDRES